MLTNKKLDELERGAMVALELPSQSADVQAAVLLGLITALREARKDSDENANAADRAYKRAEKAEAEAARLREAIRSVCDNCEDDGQAACTGCELANHAPTAGTEE